MKIFLPLLLIFSIWGKVSHSKINTNSLEEISDLERPTPHVHTLDEESK